MDDGSEPVGFSFDDMVAFGVAHDLTPEQLRTRLDEAVAASAPAMADRLLATLPDMVAQHRLVWADVERVVAESWGDAFDLTYGVMVACQETVTRWARGVFGELRDPGRALPIVVAALVTTALRAADDVHQLLLRGARHGAEARARTVHESAVIIRVLVAHREIDDLALRFFDHQWIDRQHLVQEVNSQDPGTMDPFPPDVVASVDARVEELVRRYGPEFARPYGWAHPVIGKDRFGFKALENVAGLGLWRPGYKLASLEVHPSAWSHVLDDARDGAVMSWSLTNLDAAAGRMLVALEAVVADAVLTGDPERVPQPADHLHLAAIRVLADEARTRLRASRAVAAERADSERVTRRADP